MRNATWGAVMMALGLGAIAAGACKDDEGISAQDAPDAIANAACDWFYACECEELDDPPYSSPENCRLEIAGDIQSAIDEGNEAELVYEPRCARLLLDAIDTVGCASLGELILDPDLLGEAQAIGDCKLFHGDRAGGQSCSELEHSNGDDCLPELTCIDEVCRSVANNLSVGEPCEGGDNRCASGLICLDINGGNDPVCEDLPEGGQTCKGTLDLCARQFYCEQSSKTCTPLPGAGEPCAPFPNYLQARCADNTVCDQDMCEPAPTGGEACLVTCAQGFVCDEFVCKVAPAVACSYVAEL